MKIHNRGMFHLYGICGCRVKNFHIFAYRFSIYKKVLFGRFLAPHSPIGLSKYVKLKALSSIPLSGKIRLIFALIGIFLAGNRAGFKSQRSRIKIWHILFHRHDFSWFISCLKKLIPALSSFAAKDHEGHFRKFKLCCVSSYHAYIKKMN